MSKRLDDDELNATAVLHIIEALQQPPDEIGKEATRQHLALAESKANIILNRGKDRWDPDYKQATTVTPPAEEAP